MDKIWDFAKPFVRWILLALAVLAGLLLLARLLGLQPPRQFTIATGREGGAYYAFAQQYQKRFAEEGYTLNIRPTAGSVEIIELLNSGEVDAGFVQNTVFPQRASPELSTLAAIYYEALWILYRDTMPTQPEIVSDLMGLRINIDEDGSATQTSSTDLLALYGITAENTTLLTFPTTEAAQKLKDGEIDVLMTVSGASAPAIIDLLTTPGIRLMPMIQARALASRFKNTAALMLPQGVIDLAQDLPAEDTPLIAARATLVANDKLHPDLARLLLIIATEVHSPGGVLEQINEFPAATSVGIPMNADAARYLENGPTGLERYLPLWLASRLERFIFLLLPIALVLYPLLRGLPSVAVYMNQYRVRRRYQHVRSIDRSFQQYNQEQLDAAIADLESRQQELAERVKVPTTLLNELYDLRMHTDLTLNRLYAKRAAEAGRMPADPEAS